MKMNTPVAYVWLAEPALVGKLETNSIYQTSLVMNKDTMTAHKLLLWQLTNIPFGGSSLKCFPGPRFVTSEASPCNPRPKEKVRLGNLDRERRANRRFVQNDIHSIRILDSIGVRRTR